MQLSRSLWRALGGEDARLDALHFSGPSGGLPSRFHVSELASATIGVATLAAAELCAARRTPHPLPDDVSAPLSAVRVLDMTRVIAGPVGTRYLAAFGADVLRIDPPKFEEVAALLPETTRGKRCAALDLREPGDRSIWE